MLQDLFLALDWALFFLVGLVFCLTVLDEIRGVAGSPFLVVPSHIFSFWNKNKHRQNQEARNRDGKEKRNIIPRGTGSFMGPTLKGRVCAMQAVGGEDARVDPTAILHRARNQSAAPN